MFLVVFLNHLSPPDKPLPSDHIAHLDKLYGLVASKNAEICYRFYLLALKSEDAKEFAAAAADWVVGSDGTWVQGRMKYCRPIFKAIHEVDPVLAKKTFDSYGKYFHPIAQKWIKKVCLVFSVRDAGLHVYRILSCKE
jgi:leukotriene-A4 hydrolase